MPPERDSDEGTGFETSAELRHTEEREPSPRPMDERQPQPMWLGSSWFSLLVALLVIGLVIYIVVRVV